MKAGMMTPADETAWESHQADAACESRQAELASGFPPADSADEPAWEPYRALYLHIPFCKQRCLYCDFATRATPKDDASIDDYIERLVLDVRRAGRSGLLGAVETVYIGGGTPSHIGPSRLSMLLYTLSLSMHLTPEVECTMEANPESLTPNMVRDLWALGVNRLSMGVQSFDDAVLRTLGRIHDADTARAAIAMAQERFENVSIDLMCGIPGQTLDSFTSDVREALRLGVRHVSVYPLMIEEGTPFDQAVCDGRLPMPDDDLQADMMEAAETILRDAGMHRYEVASYAYPGFESRHNQAYWTGVPYLGMGRSAVTMRQTAHCRERLRDGEVEERLDRKQMLAEDLMLGMRRSVGVSCEQVDAVAAEIPETRAVFDSLIARGLVRQYEGRFQPTEEGWLRGNEVYGALLNLAP